MYEVVYVFVWCVVDLYVCWVFVFVVGDDVGLYVIGEECGDCLCDVWCEFGIEMVGGFGLYEGVFCMLKIVVW